MIENTVGYSGTPLAKKLGIVEGLKVVALNAPSDYLTPLAPLPALVRFDKKVTAQTDVVHLFCDQKSKLQTALKIHATQSRPTAWWGCHGRRKHQKYLPI